MVNRNNPSHRALDMVVVCLLCLLVIYIPTGLMAQETQTDPDLPTRPAPKSLPERPKEQEQIEGGHIELQIDPGVDIWTEVEWQSGDGSWHVVEGWRGYASPNGFVRWFVAKQDLNKGPYRWQIYLYESGDHLATSEPFLLPAATGDKTTLTVEVPELAHYLY